MNRETPYSSRITGLTWRLVPPVHDADQSDLVIATQTCSQQGTAAQGVFVLAGVGETWRTMLRDTARAPTVNLRSAWPRVDEMPSRLQQAVSSAQ